MTLPEIDKDSHRGSESESLLVSLHRLGCPITTSRPFWPPLPGQRPFWEASCPHTGSRKEGWPRSMIFPAAAGQESLLACKYRALDPQGGRMFYISVDERRVRSRLIDFCSSCSLPFERLPHACLHESKAVLQGSAQIPPPPRKRAPGSPSRSSSLSNLNLQRVLVKGIRSLITSRLVLSLYCLLAPPR